MEVDLLGFFSDAFFGKIGCLNFQFIRFDNLTYYRRDFSSVSFLSNQKSLPVLKIRDEKASRGTTLFTALSFPEPLFCSGM
jgi:hypothetical protein